MTILTCDICCEPTEDAYLHVSLRGDQFQSFDLCHDCAKPITDFLVEAHLAKNLEASVA